VLAQRYLDRGNRYIADGKTAEAVIELRNATQRDPSFGLARERLGDALRQNGDLAGALRQYVLAADLLPQDAQLQVKAGNFLLLGGRFDDAKARAEKVLKADPENVDAQIVVANALAGLKDVDGAVAQAEDAIRVDPGRSETYSSLGALELSRGKREEAERAFTKAVALKPGSASAHLALGIFYWLTGRLPAAEESLTRAASLEPRSTLVNRALANFYLSDHRLDRAEQPLKAVFAVTHTPEAALTLADYYRTVGNQRAESEILQPLLNDPRASASANARLAALDYEAGRPDDALRRLAAVLEKDPGNLQALLVKSTLLLSVGKPDQALAAATYATERHPDSTPSWFALARAQWSKKLPDAAIASYEQVLRLNPRAIQAKIALAQLHLGQGRPDASIELSSEALVNDAANGDARLLLVRGLLARGKLDLATRELKRLSDRFPDSAAVHVQEGMLLGRKKDFRGARKEFERALQSKPGDIEAFGGLVALDLAEKDFAAARARIDARVATGPDAVVLTLAARVYAASGDTEAAIRFLHQALNLDSSYMPAYRALGQLYIVQGNLAAAEAEFEALAKQSAKPVAALTMVGILLQAQGKQDEARARFERALQIDPDAAVAANNLAWIYVETGGNIDVALQLAKTAQKRLPGIPEVNDTVGYIYYKRGLAPLAISTLKVSAEEDPNNPIYRYHLGLAYARAGDAARAGESLKRALALKPDFDGADDAARVLGSLGR